MPSDSSNQLLELTAEEKRMKTEARPCVTSYVVNQKLTISQGEVLYLRYKLQKGLLSRVYEPNEEEMAQMSEFIGRLERDPNLEVGIIRSTKINKVLKCILKLPEIPRDGEFQIRNRSKALLEIYAKTLESAERPATLLPVQESFERLSLLPSGVVNDWVLVIHAEEDNVVMEEGSIHSL
jgi:hypothetical protein